MMITKYVQQNEIILFRQRKLEPCKNIDRSHISHLHAFSKLCAQLIILLVIFSVATEVVCAFDIVKTTCRRNTSIPFARTIFWSAHISSTSNPSALATTCNLNLSDKRSSLSKLLLSPSSSSSDSNEVIVPTNNDESIITWIAGRRCLIHPSRKMNNRNPSILNVEGYADGQNQNDHNNFNYSNIQSQIMPPPLVLLGGMAQTIESWKHHLPALSKERDVMVYECRGQGLGWRHSSFTSAVLHRDDDEMINITEESRDYYQNVSLAYQATDFKKVVTIAFPNCTKFDVAGFSLGGRIAMGVAATFPGLIRKLHLTGVAADRDRYGKLMLMSWRELLTAERKVNHKERRAFVQSEASNDLKETDYIRLKSFAWSILMATYSESFLAENGAERIGLWVDHICESNTVAGLLALLEQTHTDQQQGEDGNYDFWHPMSMAKRIATFNNCDIQVGQINIGENDKMVTANQAKRLSASLRFGDESIKIYKECGHAVLTERPREWRNEVLRFLTE